MAEKTNFIQKILGGFTSRGRALAGVAKGRACVKNNEPENAIQHYTAVIDAAKTPRDVKAMALFNRALVYATLDKDRDATRDLNAVIDMPETMSKIKQSAREKLVRMQRKLKRTESPS